MARIAFVSDAAYPWVQGGVQASEYKVMRELAKKHTVYSFSLMFKGMRPSFSKDGIHYIAFRKSDAGELYVKGKRSIALARAFAAGIGKVMDGYSFDLVVANAFPYLHIAAVKRHCRKTGAKLVLDVAEVWDLAYWKRYLGAVKGTLAHMYMKRALKDADAYIANSSTTAEKLHAMGIEKGKVRIFSPILDASYMGGIKAGRPKNRIIYVGRLVKEKKVEMLVMAAKSAARMEPGLKVLIVGEGPEEGALRSMVAREGLEGTAEIIPPIKKEHELYKAIKESKVLVNMSEREGLSAIAIESLALGTPVLLPSYTPIPEEVRRMCVVKNIGEMPIAMAQIVDAKNKTSFIKHREELKRFRISEVNAFYAKLIYDLRPGTSHSQS